jgi:hypothetical protein
MDVISKPLPCRGCLADCKNYAYCDGKLWRLSEEDVALKKPPIKNITVDKQK